MRVRIVSRSNRKDAAVGNVIMEVTVCMRNDVCKIECLWDGVHLG